MNKFHDALKILYGPKGPEATALFSADGNTRLTDKDVNFERWTKHFNSVLKGSLSINNDAIDRLPRTDYSALLDEFRTVLDTIKKTTIQQLSSGKVPGADANKAGDYPWQRN